MGAYRCRNNGIIEKVGFFNSFKHSSLFNPSILKLARISDVDIERLLVQTKMKLPEIPIEDDLFQKEETEKRNFVKKVPRLPLRRDYCSSPPRPCIIINKCTILVHLINTRLCLHASDCLHSKLMVEVHGREIQFTSPLYACTSLYVMLKNYPVTVH